MTENELELLKLIRECENPKQAMLTAVQIICRYIALLESCQVPASVDHQVHD